MNLAPGGMGAVPAVAGQSDDNSAYEVAASPLIREEGALPPRAPHLGQKLVNISHEE